MILDSFQLEGQVALVTGTFHGLGQAIALALAEVGADICVGFWQCHSNQPSAGACLAISKGQWFFWRQLPPTIGMVSLCWWMAVG